MTVAVAFAVGAVAGFAGCGLALIRRDSRRARARREARAQALADAVAPRLPATLVPYPAIPATNAMYARTGWS